MAMLYALVARGTVILSEFTATSTNASTIAKQILEKVPGNNDSNVSYSQDRYVFHVKRTDGRRNRRKIRTDLWDAMNDEFSRFLSQQIEYYSNDPNADRIKGEMRQVRDIMIENIDIEVNGLSFLSIKPPICFRKQAHGPLNTSTTGGLSLPRTYSTILHFSASLS